MSDLLRLGPGPWVAALPGVGDVSVGTDGAITVTTARGADPGAEAMLRSCWGEPLSWLRLGNAIIRATTMQDPQTGWALAVVGSGAVEQSLMAELADQAWAVVADAVAPVRTVCGAAHAQPSGRRPVVSRRLAGSRGMRVLDLPRPGGNAVGVRVPVCDGPARLGGLALVERGPALRKTSLPSWGRVRLAQGLLLDINRTVHGPRAVFAHAAALARVPMARFEIEDDRDAGGVRAAAAGITAWWRGLGAGA